MSLKLSKSVPGLVVEAGELDNRMGMFEQSNAYNPDAPGISAKLSKGKDPFASINLDPRADATLPFQKSEPAKDCGYMEKSDLEDALDALCKADDDDEEEEDPDPAATEAAKEEKKGNPPEKPTGDMPDFGKSGAGSRGGKVIGKTRSGKPIYDSHDHKGHTGFSKQDHKDAGSAHAKAMNAIHKELGGDTPNGRNQDKLTDHMEQLEMHDESAKKMKKSEEAGDFGKSGGAGSRGGKVVGRTSSGKPKYESERRQIAGIHGVKVHRADWSDGTSNYHVSVGGNWDSGHQTPEAATKRMEELATKRGWKKSEEAGDVSTNGEDPKLKRHKRQFDKLRKLHENSTELQKKSLRGERVAARLKKCIIDEVRSVIKGYGAENLIDTHGEQFMSDADKEVLNFIRSIERLDVDLCPTHNPPVPRSYASHKSMTAEQEEFFIAEKAFD